MWFISFILKDENLVYKKEIFFYEKEKLLLVKRELQWRVPGCLKLPLEY